MVLVRGIDWSTGQGNLEFGDDSSAQFSYLDLRNARVGFRVLDERKWCLGYFVFDDGGRFWTVPCKTNENVAKGRSCSRCAGLDESTFLHNAHLGRSTPLNVRTYLSQPHWLYIATFANGESKVGTVSDERKTTRLQEQGAVIARFVARTSDGLHVRELEDQVSAALCIRQSMGSNRKALSWLSALPFNQIDGLNRAMSATVSDFLLTSIDSRAVLAKETWRTTPDAFFTQTLPLERFAYPREITVGAHVLDVVAVKGQSALCSVLDRQLKRHQYIVNLAPLAGRKVEPGLFSVEYEDVPMTLF